MSIQIFLVTLALLLVCSTPTWSTEAPEHSVPWIARLLERNDASNESDFVCTGSLLRTSPDQEESDVVVTSAECLDEIDWSQNGKMVCLGEHNLDKKVEGQECISQDRPEYETHDAFDEKCELCANIGVFLLDHPVKFSKTIQPIDLPARDEALPIGAEVFAAGWGFSESCDSNETSSSFQQFGLKILSDDICDKEYEIKATAGERVCVADPTGTLKACDNTFSMGSPLFYKRPDGKTVLYGIKSFGGTEKPNSPWVYVRVAKYAKWIPKAIKKARDAREETEGDDDVDDENDDKDEEEEDD